jgi:hypothetical protein
MKKLIFLLCTGTVLSGCGWHKIGGLTVASTRNFEAAAPYVLIKKGVEGKVKNKGIEVLQSCINDAVSSEIEGEFLKNAVFYIKSNGKKIKVVGDVWGLKQK